MTVTPRQIEVALGQVRAHLTASLAPMDAVYVLGSYQRVILPNLLRGRADEPQA